MKSQQMELYSPENYRTKRDFGHGSFSSHVSLQGLKSVTEPIKNIGKFPEFQIQDDASNGLGSTTDLDTPRWLYV
jgi:hypothetical protein